MTHWNVAQPPRRLRASLGWEWAQHAAPLQVCRRSPLSEVIPPLALVLTAACRHSTLPDTVGLVLRSEEASLPCFAGLHSPASQGEVGFAG